MALRASSRGLAIVDQARRNQGWSRQASIWYQTALTSLATLRRFWKGEPIQRETFMRICCAVGLENWEEIVDRTTVSIPPLSPLAPTQDWGEAPDVSIFYGRNEELATLEQWIVQDRCRLVALLGIGGIGKTTLAVKLVEQIQDQFEYVIWRSLCHAPSIEHLLGNLTAPFSDQQTQVDLSQSLDYLRKHRCLLVLDQVETILRSGSSVGHYCEGYEGYSELLKRVGVERHQSCLVLTSWEKPREIASLEGSRLLVRSLVLPSLGEAAKEILREKGLLYEEQPWQTLIQIYQGNPLALKIVSTTIKELFAGSVFHFLRHNTLILGDFCQLLDQQFERLSDLEKQLMYELATCHEPVSLSKLTANSLTVSKSEVIEALEALGRRSLIEKATPTLIEKSTEENEVLFTLQPIVMKYVKRTY